MQTRSIERKSSAGANDLQCGRCGRAFSRREHLERHNRIHTKEKPFTCIVCGKSYGRRDVYARHLQTHGSSIGNQLVRRQNIHVACDSCHNRKVKCHTAEIPCLRCKQEGLACTFRRREASFQEPAMSPSGTASIANKNEQHEFPGLCNASVDLTGSPNSTLAGNDANPQARQQGFERFDEMDTVADSMGVQEFSNGISYDIDPFLMLFDDYSFEALPQGRHDFYGDFTVAYDPVSAGFDFSSWNGLLNPRDVSTDSLGTQSDELPLECGTNKRTNYHHHELAQHPQNRAATAYSKLHDFATRSQSTRQSSFQSAQNHENHLQDPRQMYPVACDKLVIDVFIGLFQVHVAPMFPCFEGFIVNSSTPEEIYMAMAASGGLYCEVPKSEIVAKWLMHMARRKLLSSGDFCSLADCDIHQLYLDGLIMSSSRLRTIQAFILLEIFAFLCGDKRILLLLEVYHSEVLQAFYAFNGDECNQEVSVTDRKLIADAVYLLECYRVTLLQRPPMLYPATLLGDLPFTEQNDDQDPLLQGNAIHLLRALTSYDSVIDRIDSPNLSIQSLCLLSILVSHGRRLPGSLLRLLKTRNMQGGEHPRGWQVEYLELALQRWLALHISPPTENAQLLFHLIHLGVYCSFVEIERAACMAKGMAAAAVQHTPRRSDSPTSGTAALERCFSESEDIAKATWHADRILEIASTIELSPSSRSDGPLHLRREVGSMNNGEPVHYSHSVYYASMVLWSSKFLRGSLETRFSEGEGHKSRSKSPLMTGSNLLSRSSSRVARVLGHVLESLQTI